MQKYLYQATLYSGERQIMYYQTVGATDSKNGLIAVLSSLHNEPESIIESLLNKALGINWKIETFWQNNEPIFPNNEEDIYYELHWIKEVNFDLSNIGTDI
jgi:hypothetical protein